MASPSAGNSNLASTGAWDGHMSGGLTARNKDRTRRALAEAASRLFAERGYASTTIQDIVEAVDVSPRTFFRYFPCKEDVVTAIASFSMDDVIGFVAEHNPAEPLESVLRAAFAELLVSVRSEPDAARSFQRTLRETPTLRGRWLEEQRRNRDRLAEALAPWFLSASSPLAAHLAAGIVLVLVDEVMALWADQLSEPDPLDLLDEAFDTLGESLFTRLSGEQSRQPRSSGIRSPDVVASRASQGGRSTHVS
jgi:AcrR family transcriptional regulator